MCDVEVPNCMNGLDWNTEQVHESNAVGREFAAR